MLMYFWVHQTLRIITDAWNFQSQGLNTSNHQACQHLINWFWNCLITKVVQSIGPTFCCLCPLTHLHVFRQKSKKLTPGEVLKTLLNNSRSNIYVYVAQLKTIAELHVYYYLLVVLCISDWNLEELCQKHL